MKAIFLAMSLLLATSYGFAGTQDEKAAEPTTQTETPAKGEKKEKKNKKACCTKKGDEKKACCAKKGDEKKACCAKKTEAEKANCKKECPKKN